MASMATMTSGRSFAPCAAAPTSLRTLRAPRATPRLSVRVAAQHGHEKGHSAHEKDAGDFPKLSREEQLAQMAAFKSKLNSQLATKEEELKKGASDSVVAAAAAVGGATAVATAPASLLAEVDQTTYYQKIADVGKKLLVVKWTGKTCGPCKMILPKVEAMAEEYKPNGVQFAKIWTNKTNKDLGTSLGIRSAPTFLLYKDGKKVAEIAGAKVDELKAAIVEHM